MLSAINFILSEISNEKQEHGGLKGQRVVSLYVDRIEYLLRFR